MAMDSNALRGLKIINGCTRGADWHSAQVADGAHVLSLDAATNRQNSDCITILVKHRGDYTPSPHRAANFENTLGAWHGKQIFRIQLGPNENARDWPSRLECKRGTR